MWVPVKRMSEAQPCVSDVFDVCDMAQSWESIVHNGPGKATSPQMD